MSFKVCQFWSSEGHLHWSLPNLLFNFVWSVLSLAYHLISNINNPSGNLLWIMTCVWELLFPPPPIRWECGGDRVYMWECISMDLRGVGGVKVCAIDKLIVSESMQEFLYNHSNVFWVHQVQAVWMCVHVDLCVWDTDKVKLIMCMDTFMYKCMFVFTTTIIKKNNLLRTVIALM